MKERGIIMQPESIEAILAGRKIQTRRIIKHQPSMQGMTLGRLLSTTSREKKKHENKLHWVKVSESGYGIDHEDDVFFNCPYGQPGDRLYVKESWKPKAWDCEGSWWIKYKDSRVLYIDDCLFDEDFKDNDFCIRLTDYLDSKGCEQNEEGNFINYENLLPWRSPLFMPRKAASLWLEVEEVKVERVQDISEEDAKAEGLACVSKDGFLYKYGIPDNDGMPGTDDAGWPWPAWEISPIEAYKRMWCQINSPESWEVNPWVWAVKFKLISATGRP